MRRTAWGHHTPRPLWRCVRQRLAHATTDQRMKPPMTTATADHARTKAGDCWRHQDNRDVKRATPRNGSTRADPTDTTASTADLLVHRRHEEGYRSRAVYGRSPACTLCHRCATLSSPVSSAM